MEHVGVIKIKRSDTGPMLFYIAFLLLFIFSFYNTTTFIGVYAMPAVLSRLVRVVAGILIGIKCVSYDKFTVGQFFTFLILVTLGVMCWIYSDRATVLDFILICVGCKGIDFKRLVKIYFYVGMILLGITVLCSLTGVIENYATVRSGSNITRYGFGIIYSTDFAAHIFFLLLAYHYIRNHKINILDIIIHLGIIGFLDRFCNTRLSEGMILLTLIFFIMYDYRSVIFNCRLFKLITTWITLFAGVFSLLITYAYSESSSLMVSIDSNFFSSRLRIGKRIMDQFGFTLFGQYIRMQGQGYKTHEADAALGITYLDSSYVQIIMLYGIVLFLVLMLCYTIAANRVWKDGDMRLAIITVLIAVDSIWNQYLISVAYNPFIVMVGIYLLSSVRERSPKTTHIEHKKICENRPKSEGFI